jgi:hypothetical protein
VGVKWRALDLKAGLVYVIHQADRYGEYVELKTPGSRRAIDLPARLVAQLREHQATSRVTRRDDYVFASTRGGPLDHRNAATRIVERAVKRAELDPPPPTFHDLRHTYASMLIAEGADVVEGQTALGPSKASTTAGVYLHEFDRAGRGRSAGRGSSGSSASRRTSRPPATRSATRVTAGRLPQNWESLASAVRAAVRRDRGPSVALCDGIPARRRFP